MSRRLRHLHDGDLFSGPFDLGWADDGTRLWYPHVQVRAPEAGEVAAGFAVARLLDDNFNPVAEQHWPAKWLTHTRGIRRQPSSIPRGPRIT